MTQDNSSAQLVERLRRQARTSSDIQRKIAQAKSLRQEGHDPPRDDLYMWPAPEQTIEWQAADLIEALARPQPSTSSVEAVARALAADIMAAMRRARLPKEYADEAHDEFEALTLVPMLLAALPSPEREPMREEWQPLRDLVDAARGLSHGVDWNNGTNAKLHGYRRKLLDALPGAEAALAALAPPAAQSGDRT